MILLYLDESGSVDRPDDHFVVGGVAIHEADLAQMRRRIEIVVRRHLLEHQRGWELHAQPMRRGDGPWGVLPSPIKMGLLRDIPALLGGFRSPGGHPYGLFATVKAPNAVPKADPLERTFEEVLLRFTEMLIRTTHGGSEPQMGIVVADEAKYEKIIQPLVESWREIGTRQGALKKLARLVEVPLFVDSKATRLIQMADFVAHAVFRSYSARDDTLFEPLLPAFDTRAGVLHGLVHLTPAFRSCSCPACVSRRTASQIQASLAPQNPKPNPPRAIRRIRPTIKDLPTKHERPDV
jgi:hypothetical protein